MRHRLELLTNEEMAAADAAAVEAGVPSLTLMENAGRAVADEAETLLTAAGKKGAPIAILCGPGNNGGDGFVAARYLKERGHDVRLGFNGDIGTLKGDALAMAKRWQGSCLAPDPAFLEGCALIIDTIFGAGLKRSIDEKSVWGALIHATNLHPAPVLAVDVPSGLNGSSGQADGAVVHATRTTTFFRRKPGHLLYPGRQLCGETKFVDIGIPDDVLESNSQSKTHKLTWANAPALWQNKLPTLKRAGHKYDRGHALIVSGPAHKTGAARLAARGALRIGAGLVTVASPTDAVAINAAHLTTIMLEPFDVPEGFQTILNDARKNAALIGPGCGVGARTRHMVQDLLQSEAAIVLDADALTSFADDPSALFQACQKRTGQPVVMTPHDGEFARLFPDLKSDKLMSARKAAARSNTIVVRKGPDTVIAAPDARAAINENAPPWLATAGSGDVLAGFITGLLAQRMDPFHAACAAVWLHGDCAQRFGRGLIAEDLSERLPQALSALDESM